MRLSFPFLVFALCCLSGDGVAGQAQSATLATVTNAAAHTARNLRFDNLANLQTGVPANSVITIEQDRQGFIWMGSQDGAYRYDGLRSAIYRNAPDDPRSLPGDVVNAIFRDRQDRLWFGTNNGLARYEPASSDFVRYQPPRDGDASAHLFVRRIISDGKDGLWLGTSRGLQHFDPASGRFTVYRHEAGKAGSLPSDQIYAMVRTPEGGVWLSTWPSGIAYLAPGATTFRHLQLDEGKDPDPKLNSVQALHLQGAMLWIGTGRGIVQWDTRQPWSSRRPMAGLPVEEEYSVYSFHQSADGDMWVGTQPTGLLHLEADSGRVTRHRHQVGDPNSLPSNRVSSVLVDRTGTLWAGTWDAGVARVDLASQGFDRFIPADGDRNASPLGNVIGSFSRANEPGRIWLGGPGGVRLFDTRTRTIVRSYREDPTRKGALPNNFVVTLLQAPGGPLWVGSSSGLARLDSPDGVFREIRFPGQGLNFLRKIVAARDGKLWIGTEGGLIHYDPASGAHKVYRHDPQDPDSRAVDSTGAIHLDRRGRLWLGSNYGFGLDIFDPATGKFRHFRHDPQDGASLSNDFVRCFYEAPDGTMWLGTANGLNRATEAADGSLRFTSYAEKQGFAAHGIAGMQADARGRLWLTVSGGIVLFDPSTGAVSNFFASDGITAGNFVTDASLVDDNGGIYFGSFRGMTMVRPDALRQNSAPPPVAVTRLSVMNQPLVRAPLPGHVQLEGAPSDPRHLTLSWHDGMFSVEFAALHFADPARNRYAYRLEGFDRDWIYADAAHRVATYTNLDPGTYRFFLKAANKNGVWGEEGLAFDVTIEPPFWATWWFRTLLILGVATALALAFSARVRSFRRNQARLERLVAERTNELAAKNAALSAARDALENLSVTDPLTGLRNRRFIEQKVPGDVTVALRRYETGGVLPEDAALVFFLIDLDHFKQVNDLYGHAGGDLVLVEIRKRLEHVFRETDYLVRWGGEEFLVVARGANPAHAMEIAERLRQVVEAEPVVVEEGLTIHQTCSIGFAAYPFCPQQPRLFTWQQVIKLADLGMYAAKRSGRAAWVGLLCGDGPLDEAVAQTLLATPADAVRAGLLRTEASVAQETLLQAWDSLGEKK